MVFAPEEIQNKLNKVLLSVQKPGRYVGGELNSVNKDWGTTNIKVALAFPDIYDIGLPNLGLAIFYEEINDRADALAERTYLPWLDMEKVMRENKIPLYSLESKHALVDFDILAITLPYETLYTNTLNLLDLANIPVMAAERDENHPLVIAGGHAAYNPEPMADFIDAFVIGEGEEVIHEILDVYKKWKSDKTTRFDLLEMMAQIPGVYVPAFYTPKYFPDGKIDSILPNNPKAPKVVLKRIAGKLPPPPTKFIVPIVDVVHNRIPVEIMRGCTRGCRFCHAGMVTRPVRERSTKSIISAIDAALKNTGFNEIALLSLSSSDYTQINDLVDQISEKYASEHLVISLPSLRIESFSVGLLEKLRGSRQGGFTLAPEAATDRMRNIINKPISADQLLNTAREVYSRGWPTLKLYFMIGHPSETLEDVQAIANLCRQVVSEGKKSGARRVNLNVGVSTFVPKPHTPFQWTSVDTVDQIRAKQSILHKELHGPGLKFNWTAPDDTLLEAWLSRGDRRIGKVIYRAWKSGSKFDAWQDQFHIQPWVEAFAAEGLDPAFYTHRRREYDEVFPWDHISTGVKKSYLLAEYKNSLEGELRADCRTECYACGILPAFKDLRKINTGIEWKCPELS